MPIRQPIICTLGHVDTGKTLLLDKIRKTSVQAREAGGITQHIGASFFPVETLMEICGPLLEKLKGKIRIPGLLVIDTPGHEAFANLRKRGGAVADIVVLVIDVLRGFEAQTYECIDILKARKTPFLVAANKIDRVPGWRFRPNESFLASYQAQDPYIRQNLDEHLYEIVGEFSRLGFQANIFNKISDFTKNVAVVPTSAKTGEGVPELLAVLVGLTQQYLTARLHVTEGPAKGTVLEVKEETGLGMTLNAVIYDGVLRRDDLIVVGGREKPVVTKVRAVLLPKPLDEIRDPRDRFSSMEMVSAASGVKVAAPGLEEALAGAPLYVVPSEAEVDRYVVLVTEEVQRVRIATDFDGVVLKADALGSLEAIVDSLRSSEVPVRLADVGDVCKRDVTEAVVVMEHEPLYGVVLGFGVRVLPDAEEEAERRGVRIFSGDVIYRLIEDYVQWMRGEREARLGEEFERLVLPGKIRILRGYVFRRAHPAIVGVEVLGGWIKPKWRLIREDGTDVGEILQIQDRGEAIGGAGVGRQVAVSLDKPVVGRHIHEEDVLFVGVPERDAKVLLKKFRERLGEDGVGVLEEYVELMRKKTPFWAA
ncbi:MAG: translation initiation factor IF-2 [Thermoproteota archaeon]|nr:translation initiation factor IF-2 [Thermoproteota archaeon]